MKVISNYDMVKDFHDKADQPFNKLLPFERMNVKEDAKEKDLALLKLRLDLIKEELKELEEACYDESNSTESVNGVTYPDPKLTHSVMKELADLLYVVYGFAVTYDLPIEDTFNLVHENNVGRMAQDDGTIQFTPEGKVIKNPNYPKVDFSSLY